MEVYEVTAQVMPDICQKYEEYMIRHHIPDIIATGCFITATFESSGPGRYRVRYTATTRETLDVYLARHAPRLRDDFAEQFPTGVDVSREVWTELERLP